MRKLLIVLAFFFSSVTAYAEDLNVLVLGVIAYKNGQGVALLKHLNTNRVTAYRVGSQVGDGLKLISVSRRQVAFDRAGRLFRLGVGESAAQDEGVVSNATLTPGDGYSREGDTLRLQASLKEHLIGANLNKVLMQAASEPVVRNGVMIGFSLWDIEPGSIFEVAGFRDGDIVTHIDGQAINDAGRAIAILNSLRNTSSAEVTFLRNEKEQKLKLVIQ